jgi:hypothetical protein
MFILYNINISYFILYYKYILNIRIMCVYKMYLSNSMCGTKEGVFTVLVLLHQIRTS